MNREIMYRAWDKNAGRMNPNVESGVYEDPDEYIDFGTVLGLERFVVMQYIGRKDGNDDYIFEEDIASVIIQGHVFGYYQETEYIGIVKYDEKECVYYLNLLKKPIQTGETITDEIDGIPITLESDEETNRFYFSEYIDEADINILGNVYENKELLNE